MCYISTFCFSNMSLCMSDTNFIHVFSVVFSFTPNDLICRDFSRYTKSFLLFKWRKSPHLET